MNEKFLWRDGGMSERSTAIASGVKALIFADRMVYAVARIVGASGVKALIFADRMVYAVARIVGAVAVHQGIAVSDRTKITLG